MTLHYVTVTHWPVDADSTEITPEAARYLLALGWTPPQEDQ